MNLQEQAKEAQDAIGWANMPATRDGDTADDFTRGVLDLARITVQLAGQVAQLQHAVDSTITELRSELAHANGKLAALELALEVDA